MFGEQVRVCTNVETDAPTPNLLYVDGLDVVPNVPIAAEAIEIEKITPDDFFLLVDRRRPTVAFLKKHLSRDFEVFIHPLDSWTTLGRCPSAMHECPRTVADSRYNCFEGNIVAKCVKDLVRPCRFLWR